MAEVIKTNPRDLENIKDGVQVHLRRLRETIRIFGVELQQLQKLEQLLLQANDRLDRCAGLVTAEAGFLDALIKREAHKEIGSKGNEDLKLASIVGRVEKDLDVLVKGVSGQPLTPVVTPTKEAG